MIESTYIYAEQTGICIMVKILPGIVQKEMIFIIVLFFPFSSVLLAKTGYNKADSIIVKMLENRKFYGKYIEEYDATAYIKGDRYVKRKNILYPYAPDFLHLDKRGRNAFAEAMVKIHFKAPNYFTQEILAVNGSRISISDIRERVMQFLNVNVYNPALFNNRILIHGVKDIFKYYRFEYVSAGDTLNLRIHQIRVIPKLHSQQLISGYLFVTDDLWTVYRLIIEGRWEFSNYRIETEFGLPEKDFLLPIKTDITFRLNLLGNEVINRYYSFFRYNSVRKQDSTTHKKPVNYDLSDCFNVSVDSLPVVSDEQFWEKNRAVPLTPYEKSLIEPGKGKQQPAKEERYKFFQDSWNFISEELASPKRFKSGDSQMRYSGLINPFELAYSNFDGIVYRQELRFRKINREGKEFSFSPSLGLLFQRKQIYFSLPIEWLFQPGKMGELRFTLQNKNQTYNSSLRDGVGEGTPDSINFDDFSPEYYHHYASGIEGRYEISNGLLFRGGISYDWYLPVKNKEAKAIASGKDPGISKDIRDLMTNQYKVFLPSVGVTWTHHPYFRIIGKRKEYVGSIFPTLSVEGSWGVRGIGGSNSNYIQLEADILQKIPVGLMNNFQYYVGAGKFLKTSSLYFADFNLFQKRNFPKSWDEPIGGVFQLLRREWYNASRSYLQAHLIYEFPYLLSRLFGNVTEGILSERIYVSQLYTPVLPCYTEIGYGIGNFIGDAGIFVSFVKGRYDSVGATFAFGLGK